MKVNFGCRQAFTLVEIMIAVVIASVISIFLMTMLTRFTVDTSRIGNQGNASREISRILSTVKNYIRESASINAGEVSLSIGLHSGKTVVVNHEPGRKAISVVEGTEQRYMGQGSVYGFNISEFPGIHGMYKITIKYENPRNPEEASEANALEYSALVSQRAPTQGDTVRWIPNKESIPAD
ncbi:MAG: prepilin-type N-terminal cleavage/methylation domain-containing protein [Candidatus Cloacimonetes bacterium]|nr:prepilin-type N-terminal cleavage/methylation domain-containing protein [Candidatus Cloacimonadota bacterium]